MMKRTLCGAIALCLFVQAPALVAADKDDSTREWTLDSALRISDKATKGMSGIRADVRYAEVVGDRPVPGEGTIYVSFDGRVRADIAGERPRTFISLKSYLYIHRPEDKVVDIYDMKKAPNMLVQYALLGFAPAGSALKKEYNVELLGQETLEGIDVLRFSMRPKSKNARKVLARVELWVDVETGLPARQEIYHAIAATHLEVRYLNITPDDELPDSLFQPRWPAGTKQELVD